MSNLYILKHRKPIPCENVIKWGKWFERHYSRRVRSTYIQDIWISTVFLGVDHAFDDGELVLFETMIFNKKDDNRVDDIFGRCTTWRQALKMHRQAIEECRNGINL